MRLLLWYWGRRGGGAQFTLALGRALQRLPESDLFLSVSRQGQLLEDFRAIGCARQEVDTYAGPLGFALGLLRVPALSARLASEARAWGADVVISAMAHPWTPFVAPVLRRAGIHYVSIVHDAQPHPGDVSLLWQWRLERELASASLAIVFSEAVQRALHARRPGLPVARLPLGVLIETRAPAARIVRTAGDFEFLFFGRVRAYKGLDLLRDAFHLLRSRRPEARLRVVGEGDAEACAPGLTALPGVTVEARWVPDIEITALIAGADAVVLPYRESSQSGVLPIALACGVPVVVTPVGGLPEQVRNGEAGLVVPTLAPDALARGMERLMDQNEWARLAAGARETGRQLADWDAHAAALVGALRSAGFSKKTRG